jgi:hypothetical protein
VNNSQLIVDTRNAAHGVRNKGNIETLLNEDFIVLSSSKLLGYFMD